MVYEIFFCSEFADILDKAGRKTKRRRKRTHANAKRYMFHPKAIIYCCVLFDLTGNIDETVQQQHLNLYINIYLHRECY